MADIVTKEQRSKNMSAIQSKDTKPEVYIRKLLFADGYRYRKNVKYVPGHPDIYLAKYNTALFVHGCFWHRHAGCKLAYIPKSNIEFWNKKFASNTLRDVVVREELALAGYRQVVIWECTVRKMRKNDFVRDMILKKVEEFFTGNEQYAEL